MYARVTTGQLKPGTAEALMPFLESAAQQQQAMKGFISTQMLIDRTANTFVVVTIFDTLSELDASASIPRQIMVDPRVAEALIGAPAIAVYEVAARVTAQR
jgi:heme-degrading monooxygenase HmoA